MALEQFGAPVYVRKQIVHNTHVVRNLEKQGAVFVEETEEVPEGAVVVFSAHGVAPQVRDDAKSRGLRTIDATCPLVTKVHSEARRFAAQGYDILLIGHDGHEEVIGTAGEAPTSIHLVDGPAESDTAFWTRCLDALAPGGCLATNWADFASNRKVKPLTQLQVDLARARGLDCVFVTRRGFRDNLIQYLPTGAARGAEAIAPAHERFARERRLPSRGHGIINDCLITQDFPLDLD